MESNNSCINSPWAASCKHAANIERFICGAEARSEIFDYIELFYNPVRHHGNNNGLSPMKVENKYYEELAIARFLASFLLHYLLFAEV